MLHPTHLPFVVPSSIGLICRSPSTSPSFPAKPSRASPAVRSANSALSIPPRFPLIRQFSRKRTMAVCALPSKICVVDLFFCVALSLALCLGRSVGASSLLSSSSPPPPSSVNFFPQWNIVNVVVADTICEALDRSTAPGATAFKSGECLGPPGTHWKRW